MPLILASELVCLCQVLEKDGAEAMKELVGFYSDVTGAEFVAHDDDLNARSDPLRLSSEVRARLQSRLSWLESLQDTGEDDKRYARHLNLLRHVIFPNQYLALRGSKAIDALVEDGRWVPWWACEAKRPVEPASPCDVGTRDELRTCARVSRASSSF